MPARPFPANQFTVSGLAIHLMAEAEFCPITGELLGPTRLRRRHLLQMESQYLMEEPLWNHFAVSVCLGMLSDVGCFWKDFWMLLCFARIFSDLLRKVYHGIAQVFSTDL